MLITRPTLSVLIVFISIGIFAQQQNGKTEHKPFPETISLVGECQFKLDALNRGIPDGWYSKKLTDHMEEIP